MAIKNYKFVTEVQTEFKVFNPNLEPRLQKFNLGNWGTVEQSGMMLYFSIKSGYAWDGCTPKFKIGNFLFGTPDGPVNVKTLKPATYYASLAHDLCYQFKKDLPFSRKEIDCTFYYLMQDSSFYLAFIYYLAVRMFGRLALKL